MRRPTQIETMVAGILSNLKLDFTPEKLVGQYSCDLGLNEFPLVIECDGDYWHRDRKDKDAAKDAHLRGLGYAVLRLPECDIRKSPALVRERILEAVAGAATSGA